MDSYNNLVDKKNFNLRLGVLCTLLMISVFSLDLLISLGVAGGVPYIVVVLVALWSTNSKLVVYLAILCSILTILGFYFSPPGGELWKVIFNRSLALFAIWVTAILALKWRHHKEELFLLAAQLEKEREREKIYLATIHGAQHIVNNLLNGLKVVEYEIVNHPNFDNEVSSMFSDALVEANSLMKSLSSVNQIEYEAIKNAIYPRSGV